MPGYPPPGVPPHQRSAAWGTAHPGYPSYQGYTSVPYAVYPGYNGYVPYYAWQQPQPKRDGFHLAVSIISLSGSILAILGGLASILFLALFLLGTSVNSRVISGDQYFSSLLTFTAFALAGTAGGGFSLYHSIRALLRKPSAKFALPWFWIFIILYLFVVAIGYALLANGKEVASLPLAVVLIILAAIFPAIALAAFGVRRLRFPTWTTTWRRFTLALTSGATLAIGLALILELGFLLLLVRTQGTVDLNFQKCIDNPDQPGCGSFTTFNLIFIVVAIIGPLVEETVKPLAVAFFIGRMRSASEAFILGMAAGIGFAMVETVGYIGAGYQDWLSVALERTGASLLHGFGAAMVALGWYYLIRPSEKRHLLKAFGCWAYAVFQHFVWNGTAVLSYMPGPVGRTLNNWNLNLGFVTLPFVEILNIIEAVLILVFFIYMTGRLRRNTPPPSSLEDRKVEPLREPSWHPQGMPLQ